MLSGFNSKSGLKFNHDRGVPTKFQCCVLRESVNVKCKCKVLLTNVRLLSLEEDAILYHFCTSIMFSSELGMEQKHSIYWLNWIIDIKLSQTIL